MQQARLPSLVVVAEVAARGQSSKVSGGDAGGMYHDPKSLDSISAQ